MAFPHKSFGIDCKKEIRKWITPFCETHIRIGISDFISRIFDEDLLSAGIGLCALNQQEFSGRAFFRLLVEPLLQLWVHQGFRLGFHWECEYCLQNG